MDKLVNRLRELSKNANNAFRVFADIPCIWLDETAVQLEAQQKRIAKLEARDAEQKVDNFNLSVRLEDKEAENKALREALIWAMPLALAEQENHRQRRNQAGHTDIVGFRRGVNIAGLFQYEIDEAEKHQATLSASPTPPVQTKTLEQKIQQAIYDWRNKTYGEDNELIDLLKKALQ